MMILRTAAPSPYGRKIKIAAGLLNLDKDFKIENADTNDPADNLRIRRHQPSQRAACCQAADTAFENEDRSFRQ